MTDIDEIIARQIMGWDVHSRNTIHWTKADAVNETDYPIMGMTCGSDRFRPTERLRDAWRVVERITRPGVGRRIDGLPWATRFAYNFNRANLWAYSESMAARIICDCALNAAAIRDHIPDATKMVQP